NDVAGRHAVTGAHVDRAHRAGAFGAHGVLHLHRLENHDGVADLDTLADLDADLDDRALHGGAHGPRTDARDRGVVLTTGLGAATGTCGQVLILGQPDSDRDATAVDLGGAILTHQWCDFARGGNCRGVNRGEVQRVLGPVG